MNLRRLELTLTRKCNSQCIHCQANASPLESNVMEVKDAHSYLEEAVAVSNLQSFMVFGGEPMLYPERVTAILDKAHQLGIPRIEMITNGVWGKDKEQARKWAVRLKAAGLNDVNVSIDAFHLSYTPLEYPQNAASALLEAGVEDVKWNVAIIESIDAENKYDTATRNVLKKMKPLGVDVSFVRIIPVGRAAQNLHEFFQHKPLYGPCEGEPITGNVLKNPDGISIEPSGSVDICWSLSIGSAKQTRLSRIIAEYDWRKIPIIKTLVEDGPMGLITLPERQSFRFQEDNYIDKCDLCIEIRKTLRTR